MSLIPPETIQRIIEANDVVEVIGGYFPLKRVGPVFTALCPFHQEKTPSFRVNPQRQIFKCFGCGAGGNVLRFVMNYENLEFLAAAKKLAERAGIRIEQSEMSAAEAERYSMTRRLLAIHAEAAEFFHWHLMKKPSAQIARDYLRGRGINGEIAKSWKIGYAPDEWDAMRDFGHRNGFSEEELVESGLVKLRDEENRHGDFYDRFRARVMFPICKDNGEVIAFSGRVLQADAKGAKYVNSPETPLFNKGSVLFGLQKSNRAIISAKSAIVCEGQIDLITAYEHGVQNVIAPQGTAFTEKQARILKRLLPDGEVVLCFDADAAGEKAAERSLSCLLAENLTVRVMEMPPGEDPDSLIRGQGTGAFTERVTAARDFFDFQLEKLVRSEEYATPRGRTQAARKMARWISLIRDRMLRDAVVNKVAQRMEVAPQQFVKLLEAPVEKAVNPDDAALDEEPGVSYFTDPTLRLLASVALQDADAREWLLEEPWERVLQDLPDGALFAKILQADFDPRDQTTLHVFLTTLEAAEEAAVSGLLGDKPPAHALTIAHDCWRELERRQLQQRVDALKARQRNPSLSLEEATDLHEEILDLQKRLSDIARPLSPPL